MADLDTHKDDLTTDAVPNPRQTQNGEHNLEEETVFDNNLGEKGPHYEEINKNKSSTFTIGKRRNPRKFSPSSASATIINITNSKDVHIGTKNTYNFSGNERQKKADVPETAAIRSMKDSKQKVSKNDLQFVATYMDSQWKDVARACDIGDGQISQFIADHQAYGIKEVIYQVLLDWYQNDPEEATVGKLCTILWENNQKDVVAKWSHRRD
ncbi:protein immune deficiency [Diorhabda sublineata]|uniref:protein immune deficiency n=1 Tax=Diorhabda sublineata TaxID=1163346 RepID=UPI0024E0852E|nr:protein immune deficiency [Diorhabda sublineata]